MPLGIDGEPATDNLNATPSSSLTINRRSSLGHERYVNGLSVEVGGVSRRFAYISAVHEPEPGRHGGGELDAVVNKR